MVKNLFFLVWLKFLEAISGGSEASEDEEDDDDVALSRITSMTISRQLSGSCIRRSRTYYFWRSRATTIVFSDVGWGSSWDWWSFWPHFEPRGIYDPCDLNWASRNQWSLRPRFEPCEIDDPRDLIFGLARWWLSLTILGIRGWWPLQSYFGCRKVDELRSKIGYREVDEFATIFGDGNLRAHSNVSFIFNFNFIVFVQVSVHK